MGVGFAKHEKNHLIATISISAICALILGMVTLGCLFFHFDVIKINQTTTINNYDIAAVNKIFEPYVEDFSKKAGKNFFLQEMLINFDRSIVATYENDDRFNEGHITIIELSAKRDNDSWVIEKITRQRDPKIIKLSLPSLQIDEWRYDLRYFLDLCECDISNVNWIHAKRGKIIIYGEGVLIEADPITGYVLNNVSVVGGQNNLRR